MIQETVGQKIFASLNLVAIIDFCNSNLEIALGVLGKCECDTPDKEA